MDFSENSPGTPVLTSVIVTITSFRTGTVSPLRRPMCQRQTFCPTVNIVPSFFLWFLWGTRQRIPVAMLAFSFCFVNSAVAAAFYGSAAMEKIQWAKKQSLSLSRGESDAPLSRALSRLCALRSPCRLRMFSVVKKRPAPERCLAPQDAATQVLREVQRRERRRRSLEWVLPRADGNRTLVGG